MDNWSSEEIKASVAAYRHMQDLEKGGATKFKKQVYRDLAKQFGRTEKSYEFRMQNISAVLEMLGEPWLTGLKPAKNVGQNVVALIKTALKNHESQSQGPILVAASPGTSQRDSPPAGVAKPKATTAPVTVYQRDPEVKQWVLKRANGFCECCGQPGPFHDSTGAVFLEVHHVRTLAEGGSDRPSNTVALCPNCHRHLHYGADAASLKQSLYERVPALLRE